uniref:Uncharacterized protein n=1 Tax=Oryza rufipogon TaxID=4529 RepID=A0A0E0R5Q0_ORYRU
MCFSASCGTMKGNDSSLLSVRYGGGGRTDDCAELSSGGWTVQLMANDDDTTMAQRHGCGCCGGWTMVALAGWTMTTQLMGAVIDGQQRCRMDDDGATDADGWSDGCEADGRIEWFTTAHGEIGDEEWWGMDGPGVDGKVDGGVAASQGFEESFLT